MRPTTPLLLITVLQGLSGGITLAVAAFSFLLPPASDNVLRNALLLSFAIAVIGGISSFFHMHRPQAGKYILRRLQTSWLSREALTTGLYAMILGVVALGPLVLPINSWWYWVGGVFASLAALAAMFVTAMLYATIPAMRSWHSPLTVLSMMAVGLSSGGYVMLAILGLSHLTSPVHRLAIFMLLATIVVAGIKLLQWKLFRDARRSLNAATGTGMPRAPYRIIDTGTTRPPYQTQTQVWPDLPLSVRGGLETVAVLTLVLLPLGVIVATLGGTGVGLLTVLGAISFLIGTFVERWLFFGDATHSSKVWFVDQEKVGSRVATNRLSPALVRRFRNL